jgi:hypothetical protein
MSSAQPQPFGEPLGELPWWRERAFLKRLALGAILVLLCSVLGYFVGYPAFQDFRKRRIVRIAKVFIETEDYRSAYLLLDQHARTFPDNLDARRLLAKVLEEYGAGQGLDEWENLLTLEPGNAANQIGYITSALRVGQLAKLPEALATLEKLQPDSVDFHRLRAAYALAKGDAATLRNSIESLARLEPDNATTQFNLATLRLNSPLPTERDAAREKLEQLARTDPLRIRASLALIKDAPARWPDDKDPAQHFVALVHRLELDKSPLATPAGLLLTGAIRVRKPGLPVLVNHLLNQPAPSSEDAVLLAQWMMQIGQAREVLVWLETLPQKTREAPGVFAIRAACAVALQSWTQLEKFLSEGAWGPVPVDAVKYAFQARQLREQKNESRAEAVWNNAVQATADSLPGLRMLYRLTQHWRWPAKESQVLWSLVRRFPNDQLAWQKLTGLALASRDTVQVWRTYTAWVQAAPANVTVQIERLVIGLLTQTKDPALIAQAAELFRGHPDFPGARLAHGLGLWRDNRAGDALAILDAGKIKPTDEPRLALARGLVLASLGRTGESEQMFALVKPEWLLPEEVALIASARSGTR